MKLTKFLPLLLLIGLMFTGCTSDDDNNVGYTGELSVTLISKGNTTSVEGDAQEFMYDVVLSKSLNKEVKLNFSTDNPEVAKNLFTIENPVVIKAGETKGMLKIKTIAKPDAENILSENANFNIELASVEGVSNKIMLNGKYTIGIEVEEGITPLTDAQKALLKHYKENGMDLTKWIGRIPVEVNIKTGGKSNIPAFAEVRNITYNGFTYITLSENATEDKPLLKMTKNAFGLNEYLQYVFRHETIENTEYWYNPTNEYVNPSGKKVLAALGEERVNKWKDKKYPFNVMVDDLLVQKDNTIKYIYKNGTYGTGMSFPTPSEDEKITAVNFVYDFPLWNDLLELSKGNQELTEAIDQGGSINPQKYIGYSTTDDDDWGEGNWIKSTSHYDDKEMTFKFNTDHANSTDYDIVSVKYTATK